MNFLKRILGKSPESANAQGGPEPDVAPSAALSSSAATPALTSDAGDGPAAPAARSEPAPSIEPAPAPSSPAAASTGSDVVRVFDREGREVLIPKQEWRERVLPAALQQEWDHPDGLASLIMRSLEDGMADLVVDAAIQLEDIDANMERGNVILGLVRLENDDLDEAEKAFLNADAIKQGSAVARANLAVVEERRGEAEKAKAMRWRALEVDPNQPQAVMQLLKGAEAEGGETGFREALDRLDALPGSWRAKVWLARHALQEGDRARALEAHRELLKRALPPEALVEMSGDLGKAGELHTMVELLGPVFDPAEHGMPLGNNLIKANAELGRFDAAGAILDSMEALRQPDWQESVDFWRAELAKAGAVRGGGRSAGTPGDAGPEAPAGTNASAGTEALGSEGRIEIAVMPLAGPIWARRQEGFDTLLPQKAADAPQICIVAPTVSGAPAQADARTRHMMEQAGVFSRALSVYLAERLHLGTTAVGTALLLGLKDRAGFVMGGAPYPVPHLLQMTRMAANNRTPFVVNAHMDISGPEWKVALTVLDTASGAEAGRFAGETDPEDPGALFAHLASRLCAFAIERAGAAAETAPAWYAQPAAGRWPILLTARMQALVVATASLHKRPDPALLADRRLLEGLMRTAEDAKEDAVARMLLLTGLQRHKELGSELYREFAERTECLGREAPLPGDAGARTAEAAARLFHSAAG